jgi:hypothetical protein
MSFTTGHELGAVLSAAALIGGCLATFLSPPSPTASPPARAEYSYLSCPLEPIGRQLVRCDTLTGAGVPAPA